MIGVDSVHGVGSRFFFELPGMTMLIRAPARRGDVIAGRYVLGEVLGAGGMGVVYSGDAASRSIATVAIKLPRPELADNPHMRRRFRREAILGLAARSSGTSSACSTSPPATHVSRHGARARAAARRADPGARPLPVEQRGRDHAASSSQASRRSHRHGIVHADVKSDNVLVETLRDGSPHVRLFDFGLARFLRERAHDLRLRRLGNARVPRARGDPRRTADDARPTSMAAA